MAKTDKRLQELIDTVKAIDETKLLVLMPSLEDMVYLENQIAEIKIKDHFICNPKNKKQIKKTDAHGMYIKLKQSYNNTIKIVLSALRGSDGNLDDGLNDFMEKYKDL